MFWWMDEIRVFTIHVSWWFNVILNRQAERAVTEANRWRWNTKLQIRAVADSQLYEVKNIRRGHSKMNEVKQVFDLSSLNKYLTWAAAKYLLQSLIFFSIFKHYLEALLTAKQHYSYGHSIVDEALLTAKQHYAPYTCIQTYNKWTLDSQIKQILKTPSFECKN